MTKPLFILGTLACTALLTACDSQFHPYDGQSGYQLTPLGQEQYRLEYVGKPANSAKDVEMMWHHAARERCRGGSYEHQLRLEQKPLGQSSLNLGNTLIPAEGTYMHASGHLHCLAPNYALKQPKSAVEHFTAH